MDEPYDVGSGLAPGTTAQLSGARVDARARTLAFLGLGLGLVALMGGGIIANAVFLLTYDTAGYGSDPTFVQSLPTLVIGVAGGGLGWSASTSGDDIARPAGLAAMALSVLSVLGAVALVVAGQA
jgi:hypothetical protein